MSDEPEVVGKRERQEALVASIVAGQQPELAPAGTEARARLEALLGPESLRALDERLLALLAPDDAGEQPPSFLEAISADRAARRSATIDAALGRQPAAEPATGTTSFDGGVRQTPPAPGDPERDHGELLLAIARLDRHGRNSADGEFSY